MAKSIRTVLKSRKVLLGILASLSSLSMGCSTPQPPDYNSETAYDRAVQSYQLCSQRRYPVDGGTSCDLAASRNSSYNYAPTYAPYKISSFDGSEESWKTLSVEERASLIEHWDDLAESTESAE